MRTDDGKKDVNSESSSPTKQTTATEQKRKSPEREFDKSPETETRRRILWTDDEVAKVRDIFKHDIINNNLTLDVVRRGVETHEELRGMSPRRIYDKLKKDGKDCSALVPARDPPQEQDTLQDKLDRMESFGTGEETATNDEELSSDIIGPSERNSAFNCKKWKQFTYFLKI